MSDKVPSQQPSGLNEEIVAHVMHPKVDSHKELARYIREAGRGNIAHELLKEGPGQKTAEEVANALLVLNKVSEKRPAAEILAAMEAKLRELILERRRKIVEALIPPPPPPVGDVVEEEEAPTPPPAMGDAAEPSPAELPAEPAACPVIPTNAEGSAPAPEPATEAAVATAAAPAPAAAEGAPGASDRATGDNSNPEQSEGSPVIPPAAPAALAAPAAASVVKEGPKTAQAVLAALKAAAATGVSTDSAVEPPQATEAPVPQAEPPSPVASLVAPARATPGAVVSGFVPIREIGRAITIANGLAAAAELPAGPGATAPDVAAKEGAAVAEATPDEETHEAKQARALSMLKANDVKGFNEFRQNEVRSILWHFDRENFDELTLTGVNFYFISLKKAQFKGTDLKKADLHRADLTGADLTGADLQRTNFSDANLSGAKGLTAEQLAKANDLERIKVDPADTAVSALIKEALVLQTSSSRTPAKESASRSAPPEEALDSDASGEIIEIVVDESKWEVSAESAARSRRTPPPLPETPAAYAAAETRLLDWGEESNFYADAESNDSDRLERAKRRLEKEILEPAVPLNIVPDPWLKLIYRSICTRLVQNMENERNDWTEILADPRGGNEVIKKVENVLRENPDLFRDILINLVADLVEQLDKTGAQIKHALGLNEKLGQLRNFENPNDWLNRGFLLLDYQDFKTALTCLQEAEKLYRATGKTEDAEEAATHIAYINSLLEGSHPELIAK